MMQNSPSLRLSRLIVVKDGIRVYDEHFHAGINIIRGVYREGNSVGKSTIADMIFFVLGGDLTSWKDEAALCDFALAEVIINGVPVTLRRNIVDTGRPPMSIFFGAFEESQNAGADGWSIYPYQRYKDRQSFTQVLFRLMDMPEVAADSDANITMHQLLRLMYVDQITPVDRIFRYEANDSPIRRQAVGDLLCGVLDERIYPTQLQLRTAEREYEVLTQQFGVLNRVLTRDGESFNLDFVSARSRETSNALASVREEIATLKSQRFTVDQSPGDQSIISSLQSDLTKMNIDLADLHRRSSQLTYSIEDAALLIDETERTLERLKQGEVTLAALGPVAFDFCPSCLSELAEPVDGACKLCRKPLDPEGSRARSARMRNELSLQLRESQQLQEARQAELSSTKSRISKLTAARDLIAAELAALSHGYVTEIDARIDHLNNRAGYLERELVDIAREFDLARQLAELGERRSELNHSISTLKENIAAWTSQREARQSRAYALISGRTAEILSRDLLTEAEFASSSHVYFNFAEDRISVNGKSGFSASSLTLLRNAFHLGLHLSACESSTFRYPRFLLLDNIEDKGMTEARSQNFQRVMIALARAIKVDHQIIFTTSMIDPTLNIEEFTVGDMYDYNNKSLRIGRNSSH